MGGRGLETNRSKSNRFSELASAMYADVGERMAIDRPASGRMDGWMTVAGRIDGCTVCVVPHTCGLLVLLFLFSSCKPGAKALLGKLKVTPRVALSELPTSGVRS